MLKPLAPTLETLVLSGNKLGGIITDDIAAFTKLTELRLFGMDLKGTFVVLTPVRVAPPLRDGTESEISHTFPVPAMCRRDSRVDREPEEACASLAQGKCPLGCVIRFQNALSPRYAIEANWRFLTRSSFLRRAGAIPESIGNLTSPRELQLQNNALTGA